MIQDYSVLDPVHGKFFADLIWSLAAGSARGVYDQIFADQGMRIDELGEWPETPHVPGYMYAKSGNDAFVWMVGTNNSNQALYQAGGYVGAPFASITDPVSIAIEQSADTIIGELYNVSGFNPTRVYIGGWSYGGAISQSLMLRFGVKGIPPANVFCSTFGSPRVGGRSVCTALGAYRNNNRWFHRLDPVPLVPPRLEETGSIVGVFGPGVARRLTNFCHAQEGTQINDDYTLTDRMLPQDATVDFNGSLAAWLQAADSGSANAHSISLYSRSLGQVVARRSAAVRSLDHGIERPGAATRSETTAIARRLDIDLNELAARGVGQSAVVPDKYKFRAVKVGRVYTVYWQEQQVCTVPHRKRALNIARTGNDFFRTLLRSAVVDDKAMATLIVSWLAASVDPAGGFSPTLNTEYPKGD